MWFTLGERNIVILYIYSAKKKKGIEIKPVKVFHFFPKAFLKYLSGSFTWIHKWIKQYNYPQLYNCFQSAYLNKFHELVQVFNLIFLACSIHSSSIYTGAFYKTTIEWQIQCISIQVNGMVSYCLIHVAVQFISLPCHN